MEPSPSSMLIPHQMVGWKTCSLWRSFGRLRCCGEGGECAQRHWRQARQDGQDRKGGGVAGARRRYPRRALDTSSTLVSRDALGLLIRIGQELIGSALPAVPGDELDVTLGDETKQQQQQPENTESHMAAPTESPGLSVLTKLIFFGVIVGVVLTLLRNRKPTVEKSLA